MRSLMLALVAGLMCVLAGCSGPAAKIPESTAKFDSGRDVPDNAGGLPRKGGTGAKK